MAACGSAVPPDGEGVIGVWVRAGGFPRTYVLHLPASYDPGRPWPLVIAYHGAGDRGAAFAIRTGLAALAESTGVIAVFPDGFERSWAPNCDCTDNDARGIDDVHFTRVLLAHLSDSLSIDPTRIVVTGFSQGGRMVHRLACDLADQLAGSASVGALFTRGIADDCNPSRPVPIVLIHGTADASVPWDGTSVNLSADSSLGWWRDRYGCTDPPTIESRPDTATDGTSVQVHRYAGCSAPLTFFRIEGGGHNWPGSPGPWAVEAGPVSRELDAGRAIFAAFGLITP